MNKALLVIDYSNDFVDDNGALSCKAAGQALDSFIAGVIEKAAIDNDFIFICNDEHQAFDSYDPEAALFPPHNIAGTWGAELYGQSGVIARRMLEQRPQKTYYLPKTRYSAFFGTKLDSMLRCRKVESITVVGLCTDICILHTVIDACYLGYKVCVPQSGCASLTDVGQNWALQHMEYCLGVECRK
ncbi:MAG: cysteine hydrolase [Firmicutes bacterium]|nr:cysteine hydrolase [Bacillota bacterium]